MTQVARRALFVGVAALLAWPAIVLPQRAITTLVMAREAQPRPSFLYAGDHGADARHDPSLAASAALQQCVDGAITRLHLDRKVRAGDLGAAIADMTRTPNAPAFAGVNASRMLYAASVSKVATLAAAFQYRRDVREGRIALDANDGRQRAILGAAVTHAPHADFTPEFREMLRLSIYRSDNHAATTAAETVGYPFIASFLWQSGLYDPRDGGGLWIGLGFGPGTHGWRPDPLRGLVHGATPIVLVRFYALLGQDRLVDAASSSEIRTLMGASAFDNRFRHAILSRYPTAHVYRKTGTSPPWRHDSALIERPGARYAIAGLCRGDDCPITLIALGGALDDCAGR